MGYHRGNGLNMLSKYNYDGDNTETTAEDSTSFECEIVNTTFTITRW